MNGPTELYTIAQHYSECATCNYTPTDQTNMSGFMFMYVYLVCCVYMKHLEINAVNIKYSSCSLARGALVKNEELLFSSKVQMCCSCIWGENFIGVRVLANGYKM